MSPRLSALRLSLAYLAIAIAWAFLSDHLLQNQVQDHDQLVFWMTAKRLFFFAATGLLLYLYLVRQFRRKAQAYDELHGSEQRLNRALEAVRDGLWDWDLVTDRMFVSPGYAALIGLAPEELGDPIETWKKRLHPEEYATVLEAHRNHLQGLTDNLDHIYRLRHKDGDYRWIHSRGRVLRDALGKPLHYTGVARDITLQRLKEDHLRQAAAVFDSTREGVLVTDAQAVIVHVNPSFERITGYRSEDVLGKTPAILRSGRQDQAFYQRLWLALREQDVWSGEIWNRRKSGEIYPQWLHIRAVRNDQGQLTHYVGVFSDLSSIKRSENELDFLAHHDSLTGLPNRVLLRERIEQALENGKDRTVAGALLLIDLDHFKHINDSLGHTTGDMLLKEVSKRLQHQLDERCLLSRLGGDEFAILVENDDPEAVARLSQRILDGFNAPFDIHCQPIYISASLGVSLYPEDASDVDHLMQHADAALFQAKDSGRNAYAFYTRVLTARARAHVQVESALRHALEHDELRVHYQPVHDLASGRIVGVESLVRWQHPERGLVPPGEFVPVAEECGLIAALDNWVLPADARVATARCRAGVRRGQRLQPAVQPRRPGRKDRQCPGRVRAGAPLPGAGSHRKRGDGGLRAVPQPALPPAYPRREPGHRRLRHRLFLADAPQAAAGAQAEDRPGLRRRPARRGGRRRDRPGDRCPGAKHGPAGGCRGYRAPGPGAVPARTWLRLRPRLLVRTAATGGSAALRPAARGVAGRLSLAAKPGRFAVL